MKAQESIKNVMDFLMSQGLDSNCPTVRDFNNIVYKFTGMLSQIETLEDVIARQQKEIEDMRIHIGR